MEEPREVIEPDTESPSAAAWPTAQTPPAATAPRHPDRIHTRPVALVATPSASRRCDAG